MSNPLHYPAAPHIRPGTTGRNPRAHSSMRERQQRKGRTRLASFDAALAGIALIVFAALPHVAIAQAAPAQTAVQPPVSVPGFWDPRRRPERPDTSRIT